ncbi:metallophosphoesterase [Mucilaginibacter sp. RB4R14]|uniref:metallophosphoesterase n=1 Tax=Mucilaginibacter aurantiaciroseus TaxID=2949308 RepID=UPI00209123AD|nr:metallophosphoesterase [Mucilaginibacter aurantiaciroseus]MCO5933926.1 metallophosphoesterase [Mucilaginibacter aurantiaciroseus]
MQGNALYFVIVPLVLIIIDYYILRGIQTAFIKRQFTRKKWFLSLYWFGSIFLITILLLSIYSKMSVGARGAFLFLFFITFLFKIFYVLFIAVDDLRRFIIYLIHKNKTAPDPEKDKGFKSIPRSEFLMKAGILAGAVPLYLIKHNMSKGLYDYHVINVELYLPNLPKAFDGMRIGQISDIHSGSFHNVYNMQGGVQMLLNQKTDVIFFTGDLVNGQTSEVNRVIDVFKKVKAPLGVYSILGNHDYGDYVNWPNPAAKAKNLQDMHQAHKTLGWDLLTDEHRRLKIDGQELGILGIGNWGEMSRFPKYGKMEQAVKGTDDLPVKLLLSHDPSHWRAEVIPKYPQIDVMFSGHTHGMQFGVRTPDFQWSPIEYVYSEWAGMYREKHQQIYVNVGYGFLGYPGRIGMLPEITVFTLKAGEDPLLKA